MPVLWYLIKTWVGQEEDLVKEIRRTVASYLFKECFVIYQERIWRKQQRSIVHRELLFPGCVFLTCEGEEIGRISRRRELAAGISRLMGRSGLSILPMMPEDARFLERISGEEHVVKLSYVQKDEEGMVCGLSEPLKVCQGQIERIQFKKRYAMVRCRLWGEEKMLVLGIMLKEDDNRVMLTGSEAGNAAKGTEEKMEITDMMKIPAKEMA